jgi:hypothetical protein
VNRRYSLATALALTTAGLCTACDPRDFFFDGAETINGGPGDDNLDERRSSKRSAVNNHPWRIAA